MFLNNLCAAWTSYIADVVVLLVLVIFCIVCAKKGFINCLLGFLSTIASILIALLLTKMVISLTGGWFGLQDAMGDGFEKAFLKIKGFDTDISAVGMEEALKAKNIPDFLSKLIIDTFANQEVPQGTTIALAAGEVLAGHAISLITWVILFLLARLVFFVLKKFLSLLTDKIKLLGVLNTVLGAGVGLLEGALIVYVVLAVLSLIPVEAITNYLNGSLFVDWMYNHNMLNYILSWIVS